MNNIDFGQYHHSTRDESENFRKMARTMIYDGLKRIGLNRESNLNVLDAGSGAGFLTILMAEYFPNSHITAVDIFDSSSLSGNSLDRLKNNLILAGVNNRVSIVEANLSEFEIHDTFDIAVSNLVLHNLGQKRFLAYRNIARVLKCGAYFLNADGFIRRNLLVDPFESDMRRISDIFESEFQIYPEGAKKSAFWSYKLVGLKKICVERCA